MTDRARAQPVVWGVTVAMLLLCEALVAYEDTRPAPVELTAQPPLPGLTRAPAARRVVVVRRSRAS